jgi:hypothetical protein
MAQHAVGEAITAAINILAWMEKGPGNKPVCNPIFAAVAL